MVGIISGYHELLFVHIINYVSISFRQAKKPTEPLALEKAIGVGNPMC